VNQSTKAISSHDPARWCYPHNHRLATRRPLAKPLVWPRLLVVLHELAQHALQMALTHDQQVIQAFAPCCPTHRSAKEFATGYPAN
jgi:hypothetical protein